MNRPGRSKKSADAKTELETALNQMAHFGRTTLPSAQKELFWCDETIREVVEQALFCEDCAKNLPRAMLDEQFTRIDSERPNSLCGMKLTTPLFHNALEQLYMNFAQNQASPPDTLKRVNKIVEEHVGIQRLCSFQKKAEIFFSNYEELSNLLRMCPSNTVMEIEAELIAGYLNTVEDKYMAITKLRSLLNGGYKYRLILLFLSASDTCTIKQVILEALRKEMEDLDKQVQQSQSRINNTLSAFFFESSTEMFCDAVSSNLLEEGDTLLKVFVTFINKLSQKAAFVETTNTEYVWELEDNSVNFMAIRNLILELKKKEGTPGRLHQTIQKYLALINVENSLFWDDLLN